MREIAAAKKLGWTEAQVAVIGAALSHPASTSTVELMETIAGAEAMIWDAMEAIRPGSSLRW